MKIIGLDIGNAEVNTSEGVHFPSRVKIGVNNMNKDDIKVNFEGLDFTIGQGSNNIGLNKYKNINFKISVLVGIAKSFKENDIECNVVIGCPIETFNKNKEIVKDIKGIIESWGKQTIVIEQGESKEIKVIDIKNVAIFCESGIVFKNRERFSKEKTLVVDIGGGTRDDSLWDGLDLVECKSNDKMGMINLYETIIKEVNRRNKSNLNFDDAKAMIGKKEYKINQEIVDISYIDIIIENFVTGFMSEINQIFPFSNVDSIQFVGGGAILLKEYITRLIPKAEVPSNAEFLNAETYREVGELMWS
ncbi:ParM/StbA family protein [Clostridium perfringens]|uniref:Putative ATPase n=1 Tax=Clostridium perfringens TaxID=1502 RepID=A0A2X3IGZ8_CLOPF|nr:ParM/StbA family protein [Clostridium perfringens]ELC8463774.1 ParM/StbA family protein [Clostridium perfringens]MBI6068312.1 ParM/StbA family protein [Clostridium perfringens]MBI6096967.1 ParM/StbA family protein [Clostridium perfringens]MDM0701431.1 ParM/StbA family protein [Clostridium perfringens]SQC85507.1 putative ATPase [Clostridium perfringens]